MPELDVVTFGEAMALLLGESNLPLAESTVFRRSVAGSESNVAIGLARLGHRVGWFGRVGHDAMGTVVLRTLRGEGIDLSHAVREDSATGLLVRDCHGERATEVSYHRRGSAGSHLSIADVEEGYVASARLLHFTGITPLLSESAYDATLAAVKAAAQAGRTVSFDPNIRHRLSSSDRIVELLQPLAKRADIILAGREEAEVLTGQDGRLEIARWFLDNGSRLVIIKDGAHGSWATDGTVHCEQPALKVSPIDTVGAGDAFATGFLSAWLAGGDVPASLHEGTVVAALAIQSPGDYEGLPNQDQRRVALTAPHGLVRR